MSTSILLQQYLAAPTSTGCGETFPANTTRGRSPSRVAKAQVEGICPKLQKTARLSQASPPRLALSGAAERFNNQSTGLPSPVGQVASLCRLRSLGCVPPCPRQGCRAQRTPGRRGPQGAGDPRWVPGTALGGLQAGSRFGGRLAGLNLSTVGAPRAPDVRLSCTKRGEQPPRAPATKLCRGAPKAPIWQMQRGCVRVWGWPRVQPAIKLIKKMALLRASKAAGTSLPRLHLCLPPSLPAAQACGRAAAHRRGLFCRAALGSRFPEYIFELK